MFQIPKTNDVNLSQRKPRLLIADDNVALSAAIKRLVASRFNVIAVCGNGADAVRSALELQADVVLLDIVMPTLDGIQAARRIRAFDKSVKIVMVSGLEDHQFVKAAMEAGAQGYVFKRRISTDLIRTIDAAFAADSGSASNQELVGDLIQ
jgi:DNA-binding NarL/FixJ family response regulator